MDSMSNWYRRQPRSRLRCVLTIRTLVSISTGSMCLGHTDVTLTLNHSLSNLAHPYGPAYDLTLSI